MIYSLSLSPYFVWIFYCSSLLESLLPSPQKPSLFFAVDVSSLKPFANSHRRHGRTQPLRRGCAASNAPSSRPRVSASLRIGLRVSAPVLRLWRRGGVGSARAEADGGRRGMASTERSAVGGDRRPRRQETRLRREALETFGSSSHFDGHSCSPGTQSSILSL